MIDPKAYKPCPFCGEKPNFVADLSRHTLSLRCVNCFVGFTVNKSKRHALNEYHLADITKTGRYVPKTQLGKDALFEYAGYDDYDIAHLFLIDKWENREDPKPEEECHG